MEKKKDLKSDNFLKTNLIQTLLFAKSYEPQHTLNIPNIRRLTILLLLLSTSLRAQAPLEWQQLRQAILQNHPVATGARLLDQEATAALLRARGGFDPKLFSEYSAKDFKGKNYYSYSETGVKVPTWGGLEIKGAYNTAAGNFLNTERTLPSPGQAALGFSWTLGQGLLMDERRANLRQAKIGVAQNAAARDAVLNELVQTGAQAYWDWVLYDNQLAVANDALRQAQLRLDAMRESFLRGDKPALDTLEAYIQVQTRQLEQNAALAAAQKSKIALQYYYWTSPNTPVDTALLPPAPQLVLGPYSAYFNADSIAAEALLRHPELLVYDASLQMLSVDRKLKLEKRKPVLDLNYYMLGSGWSFFPTEGVNGAGILVNDVKWGIDFSYPIPNRKARGELQLNALKINQVNLKVIEKRQAIDNKVRQYCVQLRQLAQQAATHRAMVDNYRLLLDAEITKFQIGESSVFLLNTREQKWLESRVKYLKVLAEYRETEALLRWTAGAR